MGLVKCLVDNPYQKLLEVEQLKTLSQVRRSVIYVPLKIVSHVRYCYCK